MKPFPITDYIGIETLLSCIQILIYALRDTRVENLLTYVLV